MIYEVEVKFALDDTQPVLAALADLGARRLEQVGQCDWYFGHPARDFGQTDEALRIRTVGDEHYVTYKGPLVDALTKTREEIEIPIGCSADDGARMAELLARLGFREVRAVSKQRVIYALDWESRRLEIAHDTVDGLGTFLEIEVAADDADRDAARDSLLRLAQKLGLKNSERRSYLQLLLEKDGQ